MRLCQFHRLQKIAVLATPRPRHRQRLWSSSCLMLAGQRSPQHPRPRPLHPGIHHPAKSPRMKSQNRVSGTCLLVLFVFCLFILGVNGLRTNQVEFKGWAVTSSPQCNCFLVDWTHEELHRESLNRNVTPPHYSPCAEGHRRKIRRNPKKSNKNGLWICRNGWWISVIRAN